MPPARRRSRTYDPATVRAALDAQRTALGGDAGTRATWAPVPAAPAPAPGTKTLTPARWALTARLGPAEVADAPGVDLAALDAALTAGTPLAPPFTVSPAAYAMAPADWAVACLVALALHAVDLGARPERKALATATRVLADALAEKAPGNAVEVRVPPFAAVQCVPGPRHTRGTPPNVVEADPVAWLRLATGRTGWAEALDAVALTASGERADLSGWLPLRG
jgi:hypothetical protein